MPCDGKNPNCERRRELLAQMKCLISSMDRKKPCEWDEPPYAPVVECSVEPRSNPCQPCYPCSPCVPCCAPLKRCKSFEFRASIMYRCECIKRNGLQDRCMMWDCMGRPECMTKLYPVCGPGRAALLKLTDLGDKEVALKKFYCADQAREAALAAYCRLVCNDPRRGPCDKNDSQNIEILRGFAVPCKSSDSENIEKACCKPISCEDSTSLRSVYIPSPADTACRIPEMCYTCCLPLKLEKPAPPCPPPPCLPFCPPPQCLPFCPPPPCLPFCPPPPCLSFCPPPTCLPCVQCCPVT